MFSTQVIRAPRILSILALTCGCTPANPDTLALERALPDSDGTTPENPAGELDEPHRHAPSPGLTIVDYRHLGGGEDGVAIIDLDPESAHFGEILQRRALGSGVTPHHLYFDRGGQRLYTSALGGPYLFEIGLSIEADGMPRLGNIEPIDTGRNQIGEDMYFTEDESRFYVTFLGGHGGERDGSVGVFDLASNVLIDEIVAPEALGEPFILYPHGISANEALGLLMVTSDAHPDGVSGVGNTVTAIDLATNRPLATHPVRSAPGELTETVEVLLLRDELPPFALVTTVADAGVWVAPFLPETGLFGAFEKKFAGDEQGLGVALEFYIQANASGEHELYVSFASPGMIAVFGLEQLPELALRRVFPSAAGAHHLSFFETRSGRAVVAVQNNLINLDGLNAGTLTVHDVATGEQLGELDLRARDGLLPESIESAFGAGHDYHH
jgi:hypothetical protein